MATLTTMDFGLISRSRPMTSEPTGIETFKWKCNAREDEQEAAENTGLRNEKLTRGRMLALT